MASLSRPQTYCTAGPAILFSAKRLATGESNTSNSSRVNQDRIHVARKGINSSINTGNPIPATVWLIANVAANPSHASETNRITLRVGTRRNI